MVYSANGTEKDESRLCKPYLYEEVHQAIKKSVVESEAVQQFSVTDQNDVIMWFDVLNKLKSCVC